MKSDKRFLILSFCGILLLSNLPTAFALPSTSTQNGNVKQSITAIDKDTIVVITLTNCPECREMLKPYLEVLKKNYGAEIKEYQVASPFDPKLNEIYSQNQLNRSRGGGMPIIGINENTYRTMRVIQSELDKYIRGKK